MYGYRKEKATGLLDMGRSENSGRLLGPLNTRCRIILRSQKGTMILITTHVESHDVPRGEMYSYSEPWSNMQKQR